MTDAELVFGDLPILTSAAPDPAAKYVIEVGGDGADWGNPEAVVASVASLLMDGDKAKVVRFGNRQMTIPIQITGATLDDVAEGEAALMAEVNKGRNTLTWKPPGIETLSVHDVVHSVLSFNFVDLNENRVARQFTLTLTCIPFARRAEPTVVVAEPIPDEEASHDTVDDGTSLTGWATSSGSLSVVEGAVRCTPDGDPAVMTRSGLAVSVADSEFVVLDMEGVSGNLGKTIQDQAGSTIPVDVRAVEYVGSNRRRWYLSPAASITLGQVTILVGSEASWVAVHEIYITDQYPKFGTSRQRTFVADIPGTARTMADLVVTGESGASLGTDVLVYTAPADSAFAPPLRRWLSSAPGVGGAPDVVSGAVNLLSQGVTFSPPITQALSGTHLLMARVRSNVAATSVPVAWSVGLDDDGLVPGGMSGVTSVDIDDAWSIHQLAIISLPVTRMAAASTRLTTISLGTQAEDILIDEAWIFNLDAGVLSWVSGLAEDGPSRFVARSAGLETGLPEWFVGDAADDSLDLACAALMPSPGVHEFVPGTMNIFVVTSGTTSQKVTVEAFARFAHNVTPRES